MQKVRRHEDEWVAPLVSGSRASWPLRRHGKGPLGPCFIVGTWDDFEGFHEMIWKAASEQYTLRMQMTEEEESFQILVGSRSWTNRLYPNFRDANPFDKHSVLGPNSGGHGVNWTMGRDPRECARPGAHFQIVLQCSTKTKFRVFWSSIAIADSIPKQLSIDCEQAVETALVTETSEKITDEVEDENVPTFVFSGPPIDVPSPAVEKLLGHERKVQVAQARQLLLDYENDTVYPRVEDAQFINRDGYEVFLLTDAMSQVRNRLQRPEASRICCEESVSQPIVIVALMAVHITKQARLDKLRHTLLSIQQQQVTHEAEFVMGISWYASTPEFCESLQNLFANFKTARSRCVTRKTRASSSYEAFCKSKDIPDPASTQDAPATVIVQQQHKHTQFQHIRAALDAVEDELRRLWCISPGSEHERPVWCIFGDDDDIWHPRRVAEFANAIRSHNLLSGVAAFASAARAEVAPAAQTGKHLSEDDLPTNVAEVDEFLKSTWGVRRNRDPNCMTWMESYNNAGAEATSLWTPGELAMEYFDFCMRLRLLHEFFETTGPQVIAHRFCDLRLDMFLITYPFMGREMGLELSWFDSGDVWMYFYANAGIDHESIFKNVEEGDSEGFSPSNGDDVHVSTSFPIRQAEKQLSEQVFEQLQPFERSLTPGRLTKYLASYRISLEVNLVRIHTRRIDQRTFDQIVFDSVMASFGSFVDKIWSRSPDLSSRPATRLFAVCQSFAKAMAKTYDVSILWHFPDEYMMPDPFQQAHNLQMQHLTTQGPQVEEEVIDVCEDTSSMKVDTADLLSSRICTDPLNFDPEELS